jgi:hypothetical protein
MGGLGGGGSSATGFFHFYKGLFTLQQAGGIKPVSSWNM